ncbi:DUF998 domain-containing protein [Stenotrophomonas sp. C3(2023)]|uniref:DUF998 domain-containing protein n=1 Tax=Stenotrophomonas sp. C3(2023) TaxID=3080277 RepID=UPI00293C90F1|nr:DUF998 domain-containing protein [Stenotrophomonas sp. C3(2023)]MDV3468112.1 DUF998 domain-containing protein [Stenotrophomonas sp. C3(2023)]
MAHAPPGRSAVTLPVPPPRWAALAALGALLLFCATALWTQVVRQDLDWVQATLSMYLHGPWGLGLRSAYCVLALAIAILGVSLYRHSSGPRRSAAAPLLFVLAALGLAGVAVGDSWLPTLAPLLAPLVHAVAALTAFVCASVAMLLQAWYLMREPGWQRTGRVLWVWAWLAFVLLWLHVLWRAPPRGAGQKLVIAVIVGWLLWLAVELWRRRAPAR